MPKKKYKAWENDPNVLVPLRTSQRWAQRARAEVPAENVGGNFSSPCTSHDAESNMDIDSCVSSDSGRLLSSVTEELSHSRSSASDSTSSIDVGGSISASEESIIASDSDNTCDEQNSDVCEDTHDSPDDETPYENNCLKKTDECVLSVLELYLKHQMTKHCLKDVILTMSSMLPEVNKIPKSVHLLFNYARKEVSSTCVEIKHYYCKDCHLYFGSNKKIPCEVCSSISVGIFYELDPLKQIQHLFQDRNMSNLLENRSLHRNDPNCISDITDGTEYARANSNRELYDLTLICNTDGVCLKKSSKANLWLLMFTIAEVPEYLRESFILVTGVWYDEKKPAMNTFLLPFCSKLRESYLDGGIEWMHPIKKEICKSKVVAPLFIADAPARAMLQNVQQFNGLQGCNTCEQKTAKSVPVEGKKSVRVYKFQNISARLRSGHRMSHQGKKAAEDTRSDFHVNGVKGRSVLSALPGIDLGTCVFPEFMHSVLLGVSRQLMVLWFQKPGEWSLKGSSKAVDTFLLGIKPPDIFSRLPRSISLCAHWKAYEYMLWLLFYSVPVLEEQMVEGKKKYFQHFLLLVISIFYLLKKPVLVTPDLQDAEGLLRLFVRDVESLYNDRELTYNVHQLLHLSISVRRWGPLWSNSAFPFENYNGSVGRIVHGSKHIGKEIMKNLEIVQGIHVLRNKVHGVKEDTTHQNHFAVELVGVGKKRVLSQSEAELLSSKDIDIESINVYAKAMVGGQLYTSELYKETRTNSYTVCCKQRNHEPMMYGSIKFYVQSHSESYIFLSLYTVDHSKIIFNEETMKKVKHLVPVTKGTDCLIIQSTDLVMFEKLVRVGRYLCRRPNVLRKVF